MYTYAALLGIIIIAEIGAGIACYVLKSVLTEEVATNMKEGMNNYAETGYEDVTQTWDIMQRDDKCCGVKDHLEWLNSTYGRVPDSCCVVSSYQILF